MIERFAGYIVRYASVVVTVVLLVTLLAASQLVDWRSGELRVRIDPAVQSLLPAGDSERRYLDHVELVFGRTETIVAALYFDDVFAPAHLHEVAEASHQLQALPAVSRVLSLATAPLMMADGDDLNMAAATDAKIAPSSVARAVNSNPLYAGTLVSRTGDAAGLIIYLRPDYEGKYGAGALITSLRSTLHKAAPGATIRLAGAPVLEAATGTALTQELSRILPAIFILIAVFLLVGFRSIRAVVLPLLTLSVALIWVLGVIVATGRSLNLITAIVPPVIVTVGLAYTLHLLSAFFRAHVAHEAQDVKAALADVALPLLMTGATTAAGFIALTLSPLNAVREFAWLSATGVLFAVVLSITFLPAMLQLFGCRRLAAPPGEKLFRRCAVFLGHFDVRYRRAILVGGGLFMLVSLVGILNIKVGTDYVRGFSVDNPVRADFERISHDFSGAAALSVVLHADAPNGFSEPQNLRAVAQLQVWLKEQAEVGAVISLVDYIKVLNRGLHEGKQAYFSLPEGASAIKQILLFGSSDSMESLADSGLQNLQLQVRVHVSGSSQISALVARIDQRMAATLPAGISGRVTGTPVLISNAVAAISGGQVKTIGAALLVVFLLLSALFTSFRVGALALLPNIIPIFLYFGVLGFTGVPLGPTTSLIACIVLGIAVDDTLYYFARFNGDARRLASERKATVSALRNIIRPVTYSSFALVLGFTVLTASGLQNQVQFGALAAFTIAVAWLADLTFTPALASGVRVVTLWDILRLDLGSAPQKTIPLFADLSLRQARVFALLSTIQRCKAGERLMSEGDKAGDIYVIIDGELLAWVHRKGEDVELSRMRRGTVMGEVGHFARRRTANVDAVTDARLLRFDNDDLERLRRRSPRIAALVFRNLNRIQAERLVQTTQMLR